MSTMQEIEWEACLIEPIRSPELEQRRAWNRALVFSAQRAADFEPCANLGHEGFIREREAAAGL